MVLFMVIVANLVLRVDCVDVFALMVFRWVVDIVDKCLWFVFGLWLVMMWGLFGLVVTVLIVLLFI